jgi:hypothetical protein
MRTIAHLNGLSIAVLAVVAFLPQGKAQTPNGTLVYEDDFSVSNSVWQFGLTQTESNSTAIAASYGNIVGGTLNLKANVDCGWDYLNSWALLNIPLPSEFAIEFSTDKLQYCGVFDALIAPTNTITDLYPFSMYEIVRGEGDWFDSIYSYTPTNGTVIASPITSTMNDGQWYNWRAEIRQNSLSVYLNGVLQYSHNGRLCSGGFLEFSSEEAGSTVQIANLRIYNFPPSLSISPAAFNLNWFATSNVDYQLQWSTDLQTWTALTNIIGAGYNTNVVDWVSTPQKYYRLTVQ